MIRGELHKVVEVVPLRARDLQWMTEVTINEAQTQEEDLIKEVVDLVLVQVLDLPLREPL